jgi:hypothetical protein
MAVATPKQQIAADRIRRLPAEESFSEQKINLGGSGAPNICQYRIKLIACYNCHANNSPLNAYLCSTHFALIILSLHVFSRKRPQGTTSCGDRSGSRTKVRIAVPLAATCGTL